MIKKIIIVLLFIFTVIFTIQNVQTIEVNFLFYSVTLPRAFVLLITLLVGIAIGMLLKLDSSKPKEEKKEAADKDVDEEEDPKEEEIN